MDRGGQLSPTGGNTELDVLLAQLADVDTTGVVTGDLLGFTGDGWTPVDGSNLGGGLTGPTGPPGPSGGPTGPAGGLGPTGPTGPIGPNGVTGVSALAGLFNTPNTVTSPPATGEVRLNSTDLASATHLFVHKTDRYGNDLAALLATLTIGAFFRVYREAAPGNTFVNGQISAVVDNGTWLDLTFAHSASAGSTGALPVATQLTWLRAPIRWRQVYYDTEVYEPGDALNFFGTSYIANSHMEPNEEWPGSVAWPDSQWDPMAVQGVPGDEGPAGPTGPTGPIGPTGAAGGVDKTMGGREAVSAHGSVGGGALVLDLAAGNVHTAALTAVAAVSFTNLTNGVACSWTLIMDCGGHVPTWPAAMRWDNDTPPVISAAGKTDVFTFLSVDGGATVLGWQAGLGMGAGRVAFAAAVLALSPNYYLKADETSGTNLADAGANNHPGTAVGGVTRNVAAVTPSDVNGRAITLDGSTGYVTNDSQRVAGAPAGAWSVMFAVKASAGTGDEKRVYAEGGAGANPFFSLCTGYPFATKGTQLRMQFKNDAGTVVIAQTFNAVCFDGAAHLVVFTYTNGAWKVYVDGAQTDTGSFTPSGVYTLNNARWGIKTSNAVNEAGKFFAGTLDDMATFPRVLTAAEVTALHDAWIA